MDGVLIDATDWHYEALNYALKIFGFEINREAHISRYNGMTTRDKLRILSEEEGLPIGLHSIISQVKQDHTIRIAAQRCFPKASHQILLSHLKEKGFKIGVVTNSIRMTSEYMLNYAGIMKFLNILVTNEDVRHPKPAPDGYLLALNLLKSSAHNSVVIEDGLHGIEAANAAGIRCIRVDNPGDVSLELMDLIEMGTN